MCEWEVGVLLNIVTYSAWNQKMSLLVLHRWNARTSPKNQNWLFTIHFTTILSIPLCNALLSGYRHSSSFSLRIKSQCTHRNSWFYPFKIRQAFIYLPGNQMHSEADVSHLFSLSTRYIADHILFRRHFYYHHIWWTTKRRCKIWHFDNVERPKTTNNFYLDSWFLDKNYLAVCQKACHFSRCQQSKKTIYHAFMGESQITNFATDDGK